jgi:hypothetical protein
MYVINHLFYLRRFKAGEAVIQEGDFGNAFYIVKSGQLFQMAGSCIPTLALIHGQGLSNAPKRL